MPLKKLSICLYSHNDRDSRHLNALANSTVGSAECSLNLNPEAQIRELRKRCATTTKLPKDGSASSGHPPILSVVLRGRRLFATADGQSILKVVYALHGLTAVAQRSITDRIPDHADPFVDCISAFPQRSGGWDKVLQRFALFPMIEPIAYWNRYNRVLRKYLLERAFGADHV